MSDPEVLNLPDWAVASPRRRGHIARVTNLLDEWARASGLRPEEHQAWIDAGRWHDALRDESPDVLGPPAVDPSLPRGAWHGPAAAARLRAEGERREDVLDAITWHTVGSANWGPTGRALFCADFLEPGRTFLVDERKRLSLQFPQAPDAVFREVVRIRIERATAKGADIHQRTKDLWNSVR